MSVSKRVIFMLFIMKIELFLCKNIGNSTEIDMNAEDRLIFATVVSGTEKSVEHFI